MRSDNAKLREEIEELTIRLQEAEALRERDIYHLKQADGMLADKLSPLRLDLLTAIEKCGASSSKQTTDAAAAGAESLQELRTAVDARFDEAASEQARLRGADTERLLGALAELGSRAQSARQELREALNGDVGLLRESLTKAREESASSFETVRAEQGTLAERFESQQASLRRELEEAAQTNTRALEAKIVQLQSSLVRVDQKAKQQAAMLQESKEEASAKLEEAQEVRAELEARVATLEFRLESLERTVERGEQRAMQQLQPD